MCGIFGLLPSGNERVDTSYRGPDNTTTVDLPFGTFIFHRLAINDLSFLGNQPLYIKNAFMMCNGEIYNHKELEKKYDLHCVSGSDCEVIIRLYEKFGFSGQWINELDGYFACAIIDQKDQRVYLFRDPVGVRPLFYYFDGNKFGFSSEAKSLDNYKFVEQFPPSSYMIYNYNEKCIEKLEKYYNFPVVSREKVDINKISELFEQAVKKRLMSDRPIGAFLSGGLDSSAVVATLAKYLHKFTCFTVSVEGEDNDDIKHARLLVDYLNNNGNEIKLEVVKFTMEEIWAVIPELIQTLETYDTTTIRASVCQYLLSRWISKNTDIRVLYSGEGSDEIFCGYLMFCSAPDNQELQRESLRLVNELHMFDCLRTDRTTAHFGLEVRVPFLDTTFVDYILSIDPEEKMCNSRAEKWIFRKAVEDIMPYEVAWRRKEAFSDSVSNGKITLKDFLKERAIVEKDEEFLYNPPKTQEEYYYRKLYSKYYPSFDHHLSRYWLPPQEWFETEINDPSATVLNVYN